MKKINNRGFTLIEVIIALGVLSVGILSLFAMHLSSIKGNASAQLFTDLSNNASDRAERLMALPYNSPLLNQAIGGTDPFTHTNCEDDDNDNNGVGGIDEEGETGLNCVAGLSWIVTDDLPINNTKTITIISRKNLRGIQKTMNITLIKSERQ